MPEALERLKIEEGRLLLAELSPSLCRILCQFVHQCSCRACLAIGVWLIRGVIDNADEEADRLVRFLAIKGLIDPVRFEATDLGMLVHDELTDRGCRGFRRP